MPQTFRSSLERHNAPYRGPSQRVDMVNFDLATMHDLFHLMKVSGFIQDVQGHKQTIQNNLSALYTGETDVKTSIQTAGNIVTSLGTIDGIQDLSGWSTANNAEVEKRETRTTYDTNHFSVLDFSRERGTVGDREYITLQLEPNSEYQCTTTIPDRGDLYDVFFRQPSDSDNSRRNGVGPSHPQIMESDDQGRLVVSVRREYIEPILNGEYSIIVQRIKVQESWVARASGQLAGAGLSTIIAVNPGEIIRLRGKITKHEGNNTQIAFGALQFDSNGDDLEIDALDNFQSGVYLEKRLYCRSRQDVRLTIQVAYETTSGTPVEWLLKDFSVERLKEMSVGITGVEHTVKPRLSESTLTTRFIEDSIVKGGN